MEGSGRDVCSRCTETTGSQVTVMLARGAAETFPNPTEAAKQDGGAASRPLHCVSLYPQASPAARRGLWLHLAKLVDLGHLQRPLGEVQGSWQHGSTGRVSSRLADPQPLSCAGESCQSAKIYFGGAERKPQGAQVWEGSLCPTGAEALCSLSKQTTRHRGPAALGQRFPPQHPRPGELHRRQRVKAALRFTI